MECLLSFNRQIIGLKTKIERNRNTIKVRNNMEVTNPKKQEKILLAEINSYLTCYLCKGYLIDATTISECLHSFCRSCIIKFLKENSYCPVCEVVINKAKPDLKLDKTLQDIVYKLVPELFLKEMTRRKQFYKQYPEISAKVSPEERGEDTERTIFNPKDLISLSMEYISDDSSPGAIKIADSDHENEKLMKRYLQCPGMCRIEVLKKFVVNKYNVDTNLFYIDVLYKRVPLPDHYTLIDIAYIYSWKRNEPLKFYFRITDINKVSERFDYFKSENNNNNVIATELKTTELDSISKTVPTATAAESTAATTKDIIKIIPNDKTEIKQNVTIVAETDNKKCNNNDNKKLTSQNEPSNICDKSKGEEIKDHTPVAQNDAKKRKSIHKVKRIIKNSKSGDKLTEVEEKETSQKTITQNNSKVYTNITLNRTDNVEIITKIEEVSGKDGQPISLNITKEIKKGSNQPNNNNICLKMDTSVTPTISEPPDKSISDINKNPYAISDINKCAKEKNNDSSSNINSYEDEKSKFLKSIELTAKNLVQNVVTPPQKKVQKIIGGQKRKNSSPLKGERTKKPKTEKKSTKAKSRQSSPSTEKLDGLKTLINNCKINIPSSLSITIKENSDKNPSIIPPVKNFIEILKLPEENVNGAASSTDDKKLGILSPKSKAIDQDSEQKVDEDLAEIAKSLTEKVSSTAKLPLSSPKLGSVNKFPSPKHILTSSSAPPLLNDKVLSIKENLVKLSPRSPQTFQKIFEESIKKSDNPLNNKTDIKIKDSNGVSCTNNKRNILEIATQLVNKKTKLDQEETKNDDCIKRNQSLTNSTPKVPISRLPNQSQINMQSKHVEDLKFEPVTANLHSSSLGMNYSVSVSANQGSLSPTIKSNGVVSPVKTDKVAVVSDDEMKNVKAEIAASKQLELQLNISNLHLKNNPSKLPSPKPSTLTKPNKSPVTTPAVSPNVNSKESSSFENSSSKVSLPKSSPLATSTITSTTNSNPTSPKVSNSVAKKTSVSPLSSNQLLEKYNIQNLAQLTASLNFNAANFGLNPTNQLAALQHAMILKHIEIQNRQNWLNLNQGPLMQYEKYLQSLNGSQNHLLSNIKEN